LECIYEDALELEFLFGIFLELSIKVTLYSTGNSETRKENIEFRESGRFSSMFTPLGINFTFELFQKARSF